MAANVFDWSGFVVICNIVATPGRFSEWCEALLVRLLSAAGAPPALVLANGLSDAGREFLMGNHANAVIVSRQPDLALCKVLMDSNRPLLIIFDDPEHAVRSLIADHGISYPDAIRYAANCLASYVPLMGAKRAFILHASAAQSELLVARGIVEHFALGLDDSVTGAAVRECSVATKKWTAARDTERDSIDHPQVGTQLPCAVGDLGSIDGPGAALLEAALNPIWSHLGGQPLTEIVWQPALFYLGDAPSESAAKVVDITGLSRCLIFGPYIRLPEGPWSCSVVLDCRESSVGRRMVVEIIAAVALNRVGFTIREAGTFEIELSFVNSNPDVPIEVRLFSAEASFEGEIMIGQVRMSPLRAPRLAAA